MSKFIQHKTNRQAMHHKKAILLFIMMQTMIFIAMGQRIDTTAATINLQLTNNQANFSSTLRPLQQIAGAPDAFYLLLVHRALGASLRVPQLDGAPARRHDAGP